MRHSDIWWRESRKAYYTTINGKQRKLAGTLEESKKLLKKFLGRTTPKQAGRPSPTFKDLAEKYLAHSELNNEPATVKRSSEYLRMFIKHIGDKRVSEICEGDLDEWVRLHAKPTKPNGWNDNTTTKAKSTILAVMNYGVKKMNLPDHPLKNVIRGRYTSREEYISVESRKVIFDTVRLNRRYQGRESTCMIDFLTALSHTGARPFSEVGKVTAANVDIAGGKWVLPKWKNSKKTKKKRIIYLTDELKEISARLMLQYPQGPLFRNAFGRVWTAKSLHRRISTITKKTGIKFTVYGFRHSFITDALSRGVAIAMVAQLCGTSIATIQKHYAHLENKDDELRANLHQALGEQ